MKGTLPNCVEYDRLNGTAFAIANWNLYFFEFWDVQTQKEKAKKDKYQNEKETKKFKQATNRSYGIGNLHNAQLQGAMFYSFQFGKYG